MRVPTGAGKTAAVVLSWLHRLSEGHPDAPRRMVYCLPMRVLVEQTVEQARQWIAALKLPVGVATLMGGEMEEEWEIRPERPHIIVGTQDMLFSRALNRGYAMSRYRWPAHFGLLNNDCLWVCDEVQLMGDGLATSAQLAAFRERFGTFGNCPTIWMSATIDPKMLRTVDMPGDPVEFKLREDDLAREDLNRRLTALKIFAKAPDDCNTAQGLARFLAERHSPGTQTIAVVNTVARARDVFDYLRKIVGNAVPCNLLHSRFRPSEKRRWAEIFKAEIPSEGRVLVATQVIEAGVDISSSLLITDLAPWSSMTQRFGRCNRAGEYDTAHVFWIDSRPKVEPYEADELERAGEIVRDLKSASPCDLPVQSPDYEPTHVLRKQDLVDLFDTTPDLSGYDLDVSRFIRSEQDRDVLLAWRASEPTTKDDAPGRDELCSAPIHEVKTFLQKKAAWAWNALDGKWIPASAESLRPGMVLVLLAKDGGYDVTRGLDLKSAKAVAPAPLNGAFEEGNDDDPRTFLHYTQTLAVHSREVQAMMQGLLDALELPDYREDLLMAALHHDWGKAHPVFQATVNPDGGELLAKSETQRKHGRKRFRHELASALALLETHAGTKFARGIHDGDTLPEVRLGDAVKPALPLNLEPMLLGQSAAGEPSWMELMIGLRDEIGVFRLAYLEALMVAADCRASADPKEVLSWRTK